MTKEVREEAALIAAIWASTPKGWHDERWSTAAKDLFYKAFDYVELVLHGRTDRMYHGTYDTAAHEAAAEAELLLLEGWSP